MTVVSCRHLGRSGDAVGSREHFRDDRSDVLLGRSVIRDADAESDGEVDDALESLWAGRTLADALRLLRVPAVLASYASADRTNLKATSSWLSPRLLAIESPAAEGRTGS